MSTIDTKDVTDRAVSAGWVLPEGWVVWASLVADIYSVPEGDSEEWATPTQVKAWQADEWWYSVVSVSVRDSGGREWGSDSLGGVVTGRLPNTTPDDVVDKDNPVLTLDPLTDDHPLDDMDLIGDVMREAQAALIAFGSPTITHNET